MHNRRSTPFALRLVAACAIAVGLAQFARADAPRVLPAGKLPNDARLGPLRHLDSYFPFTPSKSKPQWDERAAQVRRRILVANGLWPMPTKTPVNAIVHGKVEREGYTVERVILESYPGHFVTGSLFRPKGASGKRPAVLCPHGHWANGRFYDAGVQETRKQIAEGAERFEVGGRYPLQARCVQLARMGCIVFHYDMIGYADSVQISFDVAHRYDKQRPAFDTPENWGFFSTQAELRQQSIMGLQTYNSIRALDWISELPEVDAARIGVTGASGGGTQTFILSAIDPRPSVEFPAVMVSTGMQGGCTCENCSLLRIGTGNVEFAALMAPRALGMSGANDWTKELDTKGLPELREHYKLLGAPDRVMGKVLPHFGHNYNFVSRELMYQWFNRHLQLGLAEPVLEEDYQPLSIDELTVWTGSHPKPPENPDYERALLKIMTEDSDRQMAALVPHDSTSLAKFREIVGGGIDVVIGRRLPPASDIEIVSPQPAVERDGYRELRLLVRYRPGAEEVPVVLLQPKSGSMGRVVVYLHEQGKSGLFAAAGQPIAAVRQLLDADACVAGVDLLYQGEFLADGNPLAENRRVDNPREFAGYTQGYNSALFAQRVHDVLSVLAALRSHGNASGDCAKDPRVDLVGFGTAGVWAAAALAQAEGAVSRAAIDTAGFRFTQLRSIRDVNFLPGVVKYGDLPALLALGAPARLWLAGEGASAPPGVRAAYEAAGAGDTLTSHDGPAEQRMQVAVQWLNHP